LPALAGAGFRARRRDARLAGHRNASGKRRASPGGGCGGTATLRSLFDIDVELADHGRVKYYVNFFTGLARERMAIWLERMPRYEPIIRPQLIARGLPGDLANLPLIESGYSSTAVSRSRAVGMWQFMRGTGRFYGLKIDSWVDERRDVVKATDAAIRYLADLTAQFGSPYLAAAAYNGGPGRIQRGLRRIDVVDEEEVDDTTAEEDAGAPQAGDAAFFARRHPLHQTETKDYVPKLIAPRPSPAAGALWLQGSPVVRGDRLGRRLGRHGARCHCPAGRRFTGRSRAAIPPSAVAPPSAMPWSVPAELETARKRADVLPGERLTALPTMPARRTLARIARRYG
jgi:hypothetical protein